MWCVWRISLVGVRSYERWSVSDSWLTECHTIEFLRRARGMFAKYISFHLHFVVSSDFIAILMNTFACHCALVFVFSTCNGFHYCTSATLSFNFRQKPLTTTVKSNSIVRFNICDAVCVCLCVIESAVVYAHFRPSVCVRTPFSRVWVRHFSLSVVLLVVYSRTKR